MTSTRRKWHLVRKVCLVSAGMVVFLGSYVGCKIGQTWLVGKGVMHADTANHLNNTVFAPLMLAVRYDVCGAGHLPDLLDDIYWLGRGQPRPGTVVDAFDETDIRSTWESTINDQP